MFHSFLKALSSLWVHFIDRVSVAFLFLLVIWFLFCKFQIIHYNLNACTFYLASLVAQLVKNPPAMQETWVWSLGWEDPLEKGKATHFSILAWRISWTHKESAGLNNCFFSLFFYGALRTELCWVFQSCPMRVWPLQVRPRTSQPSHPTGYASSECFLFYFV